MGLRHWLAKKFASVDGKSIAWLIENDRGWTHTGYRFIHKETGVQVWVANKIYGLGVGVSTDTVFGIVNPSEGNLSYWDRVLIWNAYRQFGSLGISSAISSYTMKQAE
jgi:hypothetical protein